MRTHVIVRVGWVLLGLGLSIAYSYGAYIFLSDHTEPIGIRVGLAAAGFGLLILFLYILRQQLISRKTDDYKNVID